ncbi:hypothetical protein BV25DRAFT_1260082 [Artomyces pyxidatus]|uniref:Uncharacterized protein n=1 Tax=Artomyces pyxidatus TaxID=48021 RepID=A0ACB8TES2_9AGAM|nr:hypothetical protein BV25DRAFT_1260082 [Artomyces pyxidatus]
MTGTSGDGATNTFVIPSTISTRNVAHTHLFQLDIHSHISLSPHSHPVCISLVWIGVLLTIRYLPTFLHMTESASVLLSPSSTRPLMTRLTFTPVACFLFEFISALCFEWYCRVTTRKRRSRHRISDAMECFVMSMNPLLDFNSGV